VGRDGVREVLDLPLDPAERAGFVRSATVLKERLAALSAPAPVR
jgi:hypothetical protein